MFELLTMEKEGDDAIVSRRLGELDSSDTVILSFEEFVVGFNFRPQEGMQFQNRQSPAQVGEGDTKQGGWTNLRRKSSPFPELRRGLGWREGSLLWRAICSVLRWTGTGSED
jgi:hypothetical protein